MKTLRYALVLVGATIALMLSLPALPSGQAFAQDEEPAQRDVRPNEQTPGRPDADLIGILNLTPDQIRQIREIRQQSAEEMRRTRLRMAQAQLDLDEAIFADAVDEARIEGHARDFATAQVAVVRLRALTELRIRRVLTPEQLKLLREVRRAARDRDRERSPRLRQNPSAFQERRRRNQNNLKPGQLSNPPGAVAPQNKRP